MRSDALPLPAQVRIFTRYLRDLGPYLREPMTPAACRERITRNLTRRSENLLRVLRDGVFALPESPYRKLLAHAGIGMRDAEMLVSEHGVEGALEALRSAGVFVRLEEFKGRTPIRRGSLCVHTSAHDFDNPLANADLELRTGGSRSAGMRIKVDLAHFDQDTAYNSAFLDAFEAGDRPLAIWYPAPPAHAGFKYIMGFARLGREPAHWFCQNQPWPGWRQWQHRLVVVSALLAGRRAGVRIPVPEYAPVSDAALVASWLAACRDDGRPATLVTTSSCAVRLCNAAREQGIDIAGSLIRASSEPLTAARAEAGRLAGCRIAGAYAMGEAGTVGLPCANPRHTDEAHLLTDKIALITRERTMPGGARIDALVQTTLLATTPKLMLNVETGDYATLGRRDCGCPLAALGYDVHLHGIRSWEKLTCEGMNFLGHDLIHLLEEVLPGRFGGAATDYQMVETEEDGLPKVDLLVSPGVGAIDDQAMVDTVIRFLNGPSGPDRGAGERWRDAGTLRVKRREPHSTPSAKVQALHSFPRT